jgi:hypothetical protein
MATELLDSVEARNAFSDSAPIVDSGVEWPGGDWNSSTAPEDAPSGCGGSRQADEQHPAAQSRARAREFQPMVWSLLSFMVTFIALRHLQSGGIILYQGVALGACISLAQFVWERKVRGLALVGAAKNALLLFLLIYAFVFTVPTTVDRSYSVKFLTRLGDAPAGLTRAEVDNVFVHGFVAEGAVDKRLVEQTKTGSIRELDGRYSLTPMGRFLSASFHWSQVIFACQEKP